MAPLDEDMLARQYVEELFLRLGLADLIEEEEPKELECTPTSSAERLFVDQDVARVTQLCFERMLEVQSQTENYTEQSEIYGNDEAVATLCTEYVKRALWLQ